MESLYLLIPLSILLAFLIGAFFWWSAKSGQFDDLEGPGHRILMDDDDADAQKPKAKKTTTKAGQAPDNHLPD
ncbi:cbb3-type cytochrome oxidase assembly protein CcoS [Neisseriaceae bacterium CLB008]|nr:cbb3-type cytochrome oxidase assembly protein CcoS [Neisseriaceae bacterium]